ncbi:MAG: hypothetical protein P1V81_02400 [Planctomycetota bacterium]|nr:hypothetical protein [Planctomycetota bacterium]
MPSTQTYLLRATVPIPPGTLLDGAATTPLAILDENGNALETQVEVVSRYADPSAGASVVELLAKATRPVPAGATPLTYLVRENDAPRLLPPSSPTVADFLAAPDQLPSPVKSLLGNKGQVLLAAKDAFDNIYVMDLVHDPRFDAGARQLQRYGKVQSEFRHHGLMRPLNPSTGATGTLPHLFGVHAYFRITAGDPVVELDLRLHNGADGSTADNEALQEFYFTELALLVPQGWVAGATYTNPSVGPAYPLAQYDVVQLIAPTSDGSLHYMPEQGQFHRRVIIAPAMESARAMSHVAREGLGFARPGPGGASAPLLWSWWNNSTANYFPQAHQLPRLEQLDKAKLDHELTTAFDELSAHLANGTGMGLYPVVSGDLGWAHPYGVAYGGMTGGDGINFLWGVKTLVSASREGYRRFEVLHRMNTDRMPDALYRKDGSPSRIDDWIQTSTVTGEQYTDFFFYMHPTGSNDPWGFQSAPTFQNEHVKSQGLEPAYEAALDAYEHYDIQHLVRYTGPAKALVWIGNDSLAKDDLQLQAELAHLSYHPYENSAYGHVQGTGMRADIEYIQAQPGQGFPFGRGEGWSMDVMAAAYSTGSTEFRTRKLPWFQALSDLIVAGQEQCSGFLQAEVYIKILGGKYRGRQVIEESIVQHASFGMLRSVLKGVDPTRTMLLEDTLIDSIYALISPQAWDPAQHAPWSQTATGPLDLGLAPFCKTVPADGTSGVTDSWQQWASLAYGLQLTGDPLFLAQAEKMLGMPLFSLAVDQDLTALGNRAALHAIVEFLLDSM